VPLGFDSPLEGSGFELSVPRRARTGRPAGERAFLKATTEIRRQNLALGGDTAERAYCSELEGSFTCRMTATHHAMILEIPTASHVMTVVLEIRRHTRERDFA